MKPKSTSSKVAVTPKYIDTLRLLTFYTLHGTGGELDGMCRHLRNKNQLEEYLNPPDKPRASASPGFYALNQLANHGRPNPRVLRNLQILVGYGLDLALKYRGVSLGDYILSYNTKNQLNSQKFELALIDLVFTVLRRSAAGFEANHFIEACKPLLKKIQLSTQPMREVLKARLLAQTLSYLLLYPLAGREFFETYEGTELQEVEALFDPANHGYQETLNSQMVKVLAGEWALLKEHHLHLTKFMDHLTSQELLLLFESALRYEYSDLAHSALIRIDPAWHLVETVDQLGMALAPHHDQPYVRETAIPYLLGNGLCSFWDLHPEFWPSHSLFDKTSQAWLRSSHPDLYKNYFFVKRLRLKPYDHKENEAFDRELSTAIARKALPSNFAQEFSTPLFLAFQKGELRVYSEVFLASCADLILRVNPASGRQIYHLFYYAFTHIDQVARAFRSLQLLNMDIFDRGRSQDQWFPVLEKTIESSSSSFVNRYQRNLFQSIPDRKFLPMDLSAYVRAHHLVCLGRKGRTLMFSKPGSTLITAVKIAKVSEPVEDLAREKDAQNQYERLSKELSLQSQFPVGRACKTIENLDEFLNRVLGDEDKTKLCESLIGSELQNKACLIYEAPKGYFTYLYEVKDSDDFREACLAGISDLCSLLDKKGIFFNSLADIFHNNSAEKPRADGGRYRILADNLYDWNNNRNYGTGRLTSWLRAIEFLNLRKTGIADLGDQVQLAEDVFNPESEFVKKYFSDVYENFPGTAEHRIFVNIVAEYLYVFLLSIGRRARELSECGEKPFDWCGEADFFVQLCARALSTMTRLSDEQAYEFLSKTIDIDRLACQMEFWMTPKHIPYMKNNTLPDSIYGPEVAVTIDFERIRINTFNDKFGFCINPEEGPDLGTVNGQEPIKEANKLLYLTATALLSLMQDEVNPELLRTYQIIAEPEPVAGRKRSASKV